MKTQGTQTVKDAADPREDEPAHALSEWLDKQEFEGTLEPELQALVSNVCQKVFVKYRPITHSTAEELERDVIKSFGRWLHYCKSPDKLRAIVVSVLIKAQKQVEDETHREM